MLAHTKKKIQTERHTAKPTRSRFTACLLSSVLALCPVFASCDEDNEPETEAGTPCSENACVGNAAHICVNGQAEIRECATGCDTSIGLCASDSGARCSANKCLGTTLLSCVAGKTIAQNCGKAGCNASIGKCNASQQATCTRNTCEGNTLLICINGKAVRNECGTAGCDAATGTCNQACTEGATECVLEEDIKRQTVGVIRTCKDGKWTVTEILNTPEDMLKRRCK